MVYESIIGLEIHIQLKTKSKMFCSCANVVDDAKPNTAVCPVCMGHPGTLPVVNREAFEQGMRLALALNFHIAAETRFDRKNYFYPDLPKGYQISQFDKPLAVDGSMTFHVADGEHRYALERLHLEEDAAKNIHQGDATLIDFNRAGTPLAEIVTKPDFRSPHEAKLFLQELQLIARYLGVSDADMEKGQLRCDANISLRPQSDKRLYPKTEIKNLNSFRSVERALEYEVQRQTALWGKDAMPVRQETRGWNESKAATELQRTKEGSDDYRYFPEPDLRAISVSQKEIDRLQLTIPELPEEKRKRFASEYDLKASDASVIVADKAIADYFEAVVSELRAWLLDSGAEGEGSEEEIWKKNRKKLVKHAHSWITSELFRHLKSDPRSITDCPITPENFAEFIVMVYEAKINSSAAQTILEKMYHEGKDPHEVAEDENLLQVNDEGDIRELVRRAIAENPDQVQQYLRGKKTVLQFLVGKVMKLSKGAANPQVIAKLLEKELTG